MGTAQQSDGRFIPLPGAVILPFGEDLTLPVVTIGRVLPKLPAKPDVPSQVRDIVYGDEHIEYGVHPLIRGGCPEWTPVPSCFRLARERQKREIPAHVPVAQWIEPAFPKR